MICSTHTQKPHQSWYHFCTYKVDLVFIYLCKVFMKMGTYLFLRIIFKLKQISKYLLNLNVPLHHYSPALTWISTTFLVACYVYFCPTPRCSPCHSQSWLFQNATVHMACHPTAQNSLMTFHGS